MLSSDLISLAIAFLYVATLIAIAETLYRFFHLPIDITRKVVHVGVGMAAIALKIIFRDWYIAIIGPLVFIFINYLSYRASWFRGIETGERGQLGTVYFPLSFVILIPLLWTQPGILAASMMPLAWGDSAAAILGRRFGAHKFTVLDRASSFEGTLAMFVFSLLGAYFALLLYGQQVNIALILSLVTAVAATVAEALSPNGIDNLTVPLVSVVVLIVFNPLGK